MVGTFDLVDGQVFNGAFVMEADQVVGRYAKAHPNEPGATAGSDFPTFLQSGVRYGMNIRNDANHPEAAQSTADQDARLIPYPLNNMLRSETADRWREKSLANLIDRARQTGCWVASTDVTGTSGNLIRAVSVSSEWLRIHTGGGFLIRALCRVEETGMNAASAVTGPSGAGGRRG